MKAKKILGIVVVALFTILACLVVVSYFVPKNFAFPLEAPDRIVIYPNGKDAVSVLKGSDKYDKIMELYNKGFDVKFIEAFFQGKGFDKVTTVDNSTGLSSVKTNDKMFKIEFKYDDNQDTKVVNSNVELEEKEKTYRYVVIEIVNSNSLMQVNAYIRYGTSESEATSNIRYVSYARHAKLFSYLTETFA